MNYRQAAPKVPFSFPAPDVPTAADAASPFVEAQEAVGGSAHAVGSQNQAADSSDYCGRHLPWSFLVSSGRTTVAIDVLCVVEGDVGVGGVDM